jgi:N-acetylneuraminate synthase
MIYEAKINGADVAKFQTYKAEKIAAKFSPSYWDTSEEQTKSQIDLFKKFDSFGKDEFQELSSYCNEVDIEFMSTGFDIESVTYINDIVARHKIASADLTNIELIKTISFFNKPILLSTGASTLEEIDFSVKFIEDLGIKSLTLLHCVLNYPTKNSNANLWMIHYLSEKYPNHTIGYSDHTKYNIDILTSSLMLGATVIEKHFTLDKSLKGNDHYHAMDSKDLKHFINQLDEYQSFIGSSSSYNDLINSQDVSRKNARRGVYFEKNVSKGNIIKKEDVKFLRPQLDGLSTFEFEKLIKSKSKYKRNFQKGELFKND